MGRKVGLDVATISDAAVAIVEADGLEAATLSSVAARLDIKVPSLYNHVSGLAGLRRLISLHAANEMTNLCQAAAASETTSARQVRAIAVAYRKFAIEHTGLYQALLPAPKPGEDDELYQAMAQPILVVMAAVAGNGTGSLEDEEAIHNIRALRSLIHGFVDLEVNGGFGLPVGIDQSFEVAIDTFIDRTLLNRTKPGGS